MRITPYTELSNGIKVIVDNKFGKVIKCSVKKDQFGQPINVHTIHFTRQFVCKTSNGRKYKDIDIIKEINYAGINVHDWNV